MGNIRSELRELKATTSSCSKQIKIKKPRLSEYFVDSDFLMKRPVKENKPIIEGSGKLGLDNSRVFYV